MIKLLIVDDERIIRETIASLIDWDSLGIFLIGTAENGIEAYNRILDDYPDIVLTDIKMPGLSGLDLIQRIKEINPDTQFVILSGYGEFKFAQRAMQYGVKHYLLKPCNEEQIIACLNSAKQDYLNALASKNEPAPSSQIIQPVIMKNILTYYLQTPTEWMQENPSPYYQYASVTQEPYTLFYIYFITPETFLSICNDLYENITARYPDIPFHLFYVKGTIICFYRSDSDIAASVLLFLADLKTQTCGLLSEYKKSEYVSVHLLMTDFVKHIKNYEVIYQVIDDSALPIYNYHAVVKELYRLTDLAFSLDLDTASTALDELLALLNDISDPELLRQQASSIIIYAISKQTEPDTTDAMKYLVAINQTEPNDSVLLSVRGKLTELFENYHNCSSCVSLSRKIITYTEQNLEKSGLSLKWLAENYLFMNVDYLSKRFAKETGMKFSKYLTDLRIQKAKYYMEQGTYNVQEIAELVGCGQNPQYFSQIFKKNTGLSPSQYLASLFH